MGFHVSEVGSQMTATNVERIGSAFFYAFSSFLITLVNKVVLTMYGYPSFCILGLSQMLATVLFLSFAKSLGIIHFPDLSLDVCRNVWPLPIIYCGNMLFGLGGTQKLSLPMMTVLRKFTIFMTMIGEMVVLNKQPGSNVKFSVGLILLGCIIAATDDLSLNIVGYSYVMLENLFTAANAVYIKKKLHASDIGTYGLLFYNSMFMIPFIFGLTYVTGELERSIEFIGWLDPWFCFYYLLCSVFGFILMFSMVLCTGYNSALSVTVIGCVKNIFITYIGMVFGGDYVYSPVNFVGMNICIVGTLIYTKVTFLTRKESSNLTNKEDSCKPPVYETKIQPITTSKIKEEMV